MLLVNSIIVVAEYGIENCLVPHVFYRVRNSIPCANAMQEAEII